MNHLVIISRLTCLSLLLTSSTMLAQSSDSSFLGIEKKKFISKFQILGIAGNDVYYPQHFYWEFPDSLQYWQYEGHDLKIYYFHYPSNQSIVIRVPSKNRIRWAKDTTMEVVDVDSVLDLIEEHFPISVLEVKDYELESFYIKQRHHAIWTHDNVKYIFINFLKKPTHEDCPYIIKTE